VERRITVNNREECQSINTGAEEQMEEYAHSTNTVMHGMAIAILVISCIIVLIAIIFFVLKNNAKLREKNNPVKVIYILGFILLILCITLAIIYLCKRDKL
jgi:cbb3-type cytochrome oxidase subunit 3